jgi:hypothetical protein
MGKEPLIYSFFRRAASIHRTLSSNYPSEDRNALFMLANSYSAQLKYSFKCLIWLRKKIIFWRITVIFS